MEQKKTFVVGDIHGANEALLQCLERSRFDKDKDRLICLGDVCDGFPDVKQAFDTLLEIKDLIYVLGNHDSWALEWYDRDKMYKHTPQDIPDHLWTKQGGNATIASYGGVMKDMVEEHMNLLKEAKLYYEQDNMLFVHGGINEFQPVEETHRDVFLWDRDLLERVAMVHPCNPDFKIQEYDSIFIGHTPTWSYQRRFVGDVTAPIRLCNVWAIDTGAGWSGKLTMMNIKTKEVYQSDEVETLYGYKSR